MKRFISAIALCASLLVLLVLFLFPPRVVNAAKENVLIKLLNLPAPPPPNALANMARSRDDKFYDKANPPDDNASIEDVMDYWMYQANNYRGPLNYNARPSERTVERLAAEMAKKPEMATQLLNILPDNKTTVDTIKELYDRAESGDGDSSYQRKELLEWLRFHSPYYSGDLARSSQEIKDTVGYVGPNDERSLLALTRHDFDKASPVINQLYNDGSQPASKSLATWALYQRALETNSLGDIERYRNELMRIVEDRSLPDGARDMANDALTHGPDFPGRDEWTFSLFEDETLVNMSRYSMLTTLVMYSPPEKYVPKMIALIEKTSNPVARQAAVHNLVTALNSNPSPEMQRQILQALLPWLEDPKWASDFGYVSDTRGIVIRKLSEFQIPDSAPGLIHVLDEKQTQTVSRYGANSVANAMRPAANVIRLGDIDDVDVPAANAMISAANAIRRSLSNSNANPGPPTIFYPYRSQAISALAKQKDGRAAPALRRVLSEVDGYERSMVVGAILACGGFSVPEQLEALGATMKKMREVMNGSVAANTVGQRDFESYQGNIVPPPRSKMVTAAEISFLLGQQLMASSEISDVLAKAIVDLIEVLDEKDPSFAAAYRSIILKWQNPVFNVLLLHDVKRDAADANTIVRLLSQRKELREKQSADVFDLQTGKPIAVGVAACMLEDVAGFDAILDNADAETKTAMLACARLIKVPLPIAKVAENLKAQSQILQIAAERYLEAEDSQEARSLVLARHKNEAKILGATTAFYVDGVGADEYVPFLWALYQSIGDNSLYNGWGGGSANDEDLKGVEKRLQDEVKKDNDLVGVYSYDHNYIRIYKDRVIFSWDDDESRYRERPLSKDEFDDIKSFLTTNRVDEMPPYISCGGGYCGAKELVMLGRNGGRRVYMNSGGTEAAGRTVSEFFTGLDKYFADLKLTKASLKYGLSREIPGLEILFASDDLHAETVWKNGDDLRVAATDVSTRKKIKAEMAKLYEDVEPATENSEVENTGGQGSEGKRNALIESLNKRRYEGYSWYKVANGETAGTIAQPPQVEFIPLRDTTAVQPTEEQWKARAGDVEIRASEEGIFKVVRGKLTKLHKGYYQHPAITPNGRWAIASKSDPESGESVVRIDLVTNREYAIEIPGYEQSFAAAYISTLNKFLIVRNDRYEYEGEYFQEAEDVVPEDADASGLLLVDPATGVVQPVAGEFRPLAQQTFRPLQNASKANEFWAAIHDPEKNETQVGIYDTKVFGFKPVLHIPKINFNSMSMWVDEAGGKVYFVYRGHLLALPLQNPVPAARTN